MCVNSMYTYSNCVMLPQRSQGNPASPQLYLPGVFHNAVSHLQPVLGITVLSPNSPPLCPTVRQLTQGPRPAAFSSPPQPEVITTITRDHLLLFTI